MKRSALLACFLLGHSEDTLAWVQNVRTRAPTSSLDLSSQQQIQSSRRLRVSLHRAGIIAAKSDSKEMSARKTPAIKNLKRVVASQSKATSPAPVKLATTLADAPRALIEWVPRRLRKFLFKPSNKLTEASAKAAHAASLAAQQAHLTSEAHRLKDEAQAALAAAEAASADADSAERAAADAVADAARARAWAAQEVALAHAEAQEHLDAAEASAAKRLVDVYNGAKKSLFAGLGAGQQQQQQDHTPDHENLDTGYRVNVREAPTSALPDTESDDSPVRAVALGPLPSPPGQQQQEQQQQDHTPTSALHDTESDDSPARAVALGPLPSQPIAEQPPSPPAVPTDTKPLESARTRLMQAEAAAAEANAAALTARAWAAKEVDAARLDAAAAMKLLLQTKAAHRAYRQRAGSSTGTSAAAAAAAAEPITGDIGNDNNSGSGNPGTSASRSGATASARAALEVQFGAPSAARMTEEEVGMIPVDSEVAYESIEAEEEHDATLQRMRRLRNSMQLGDEFQKE